MKALWQAPDKRQKQVSQIQCKTDPEGKVVIISQRIARLIGHDPFDRRPSHFFGGHRWHGRHDEWRHQHFHGSWRFLFHLGPVIYFAPIRYPHVIRIPHDRVGVYVRYTGDDAVGTEFADAVREHLRDDPVF